MTNISDKISASTEIGMLGVMHLKRYWDKCQLRKSGSLKSYSYSEEWNIDTTLLSVLGLGIEQTIKEIFNSINSFNDFEKWILKVNNKTLSNEKIALFNEYIVNHMCHRDSESIDRFLDDDQIDFFNENGYLIIKNAISVQDCNDTISVICDHLGISRYDSMTWYNEHPDRQGIMIQLFQHPLLEKNRRSEIIKKSYQQLWNRKDLWVNTDRVGFNPPETPDWKFPGPNLHWDVSLALPIPFGLQGILYLADTTENQGAFTLVPGFHNNIESWLKNLDKNVNPRNENINAFGTKAIAADAGDFIIWHQALPHGSSINTSDLPRFVQYINYAPLDLEINKEWI